MKELDKILSTTAEALGKKLCFCQRETECANWEENTEGNYTFFRFFFHGEGYVCGVEGTDNEAKNYAKLLPSYIESLSTISGELSKEEYLKKILLGECSSADVQKYALKYSIKNERCFVIALRSKNLPDDTMSLITQYGGNPLDTAVRLDKNNCALVKFVSEADADYRSATDYANFLAQSLQEEYGIVATAGIGSYVKNLKDIALSYQQAVSAIGCSEVFLDGTGVHSYKEFILIKMLEDIPHSKLAEYFNELIDDKAVEVFEDEDMLMTAEEFLNSSFNVTETSRKTFMHRNTLLYRLDKIEKASGLNIRDFSEAVSFRLLMILHKMLKK